MAERVKRRKRPEKKLKRRMQNKLYLTFGFICILFVVLIGRLMYIEYTSGKKYEKIVLAQQQFDSQIIPFRRGDIVDSKGTVLATCVDVYNVILDCKVLNANPKKIDRTITLLCQCFPALNRNEVEAQLKDNPQSQYIVLAKKVPYEEVDAFQSLAEDEKKGSQVAGVWFEKEYQRVYPYGSLAAALLGFATSDSGVIGLETEYNSVLCGTNGRSYGYLNADNNMEQTIIEPKNGNTLVSTIDVNIQNIVEDAIAAANAEMAAEGVNLVREDGSRVWENELGSEHTAVLVMNPNNGEILSMAGYPTFDLNQPKDLSAYYTAEELEKLSEEEQLDLLNEIWQNYSVTHTFEPGSTFKPFTIAMGLDTGTLRGDETYLCDGGEWVGGWEIHCVNRDGHGMEDIRLALMNSCNDALMQMSFSIGPTNFAKYMSAYGFGQKTDIDLPGEASTASLIFSKEELETRESNLATNSFGQNFNVTMIQLASSFCSLINGGDLYQPHVVKKVVDDSGNTIQTSDTVVMKETVSKEVSDILREYMYGVVSEGTGQKAAVEGYAIGGKTGTAEKQPRSENNYVVSFIGFAPVEDPQVVVYVLIDTPHVEDQSHCSQSSYIAKNIFSQILPYLNISGMTEEEAE